MLLAGSGSNLPLMQILVGELQQGEGWVAMSVAHSRMVAWLLSLPFFLLGATAAARLHLLPRYALMGAKRRIERLITEFEASRALLAARGDDLEQEVAERLRVLEAAYGELKDRDGRLRELSGRAQAGLQERPELIGGRVAIERSVPADAARGGEPRALAFALAALPC
ncbi:MAG: hypothetical protein OEZ06_01460 [Myxococcales bacterium]|nr:hypothetical protein [Myxococcales bacterium]